ncbi:hypothetical protein ACFYYS_03035 [Streptomyces sp. NPDC002120]|uniref:hypothetical protein n=1 Tax=Streptomyces sp. NPDC002120 TaxID=3364631 RepID=UPI0036A40A77
MGLKSWVTQASRDDGIDAIAVNEDPLIGGPHGTHRRPTPQGTPPRTPWLRRPRGSSQAATRLGNGRPHLTPLSLSSGPHPSSGAS